MSDATHTHRVKRVLSKLSSKFTDGFWYRIELTTGLIAIGTSSLDIVHGMVIDFTGHVVEDPKWGTQLQFKYAIPSVNLAKKELLVNWLRSIRISEDGRHLATNVARSIASHFGDDTKQVVLNQPSRLSEVPGVGPSTIKAVIASSAALKAKERAQEIIVPLIEKGLLVDKQATLLEEHFKEELPTVLEKDPYRLASVPKLGFKLADNIAKTDSTFNPVATTRLSAALAHVLEQSAKEGHNCLPHNVLVDWSSKFLKHLDRTRPRDSYTHEVEEAIDTLLVEGQLQQDDSHIYLADIYNRETLLVERLASTTAPTNLTFSEAMSYIAKTTVTLDEEQQRAAAVALTSPLGIITGFPGTGKSSLVEAICQSARMLDWPITLASPTGKAAKVLREKTKIAATTIHKLLEATPDGDFGRGRHNPISPGIVVLDESSMINQELFEHFMEALPNPKFYKDAPLQGNIVILVGDPDQLPPIGRGTPFVDLMSTSRIPVSRLAKIYRTEEGSSIALACKDIREGRVPNWPNDGVMDFQFIDNLNTLRETLVTSAVDLIKTGIPESEVQILVPHKIGLAGAPSICWQFQQAMGRVGPSVVIGKREVPSELADIIPPEVRVYPGDRVRHTENNKRLDIFNGEIGIVLDVDPRSRTVVVEYPDRDDEVVYTGADLLELSLSIAMTIHSTQGSEWLGTLIGVHQSRLLERRLLYTATSRARNKCTMFGTNAAVSSAIHNVSSQARYSRLAQRLKEKMR